LWSDIAVASPNRLKQAYLKIQAARLKKFEINILQKADFIVPISETDQTEITQFTATKSLVIPYCINVHPNDNHKAINEKKDIFFIGALDWIPNQEGITWFIRNVCPLLFKEKPEVKIHIAGRNAPKTLVNLIEKSINIIYHGEIADASLFMQSHKVMVVPLFTGGGMRVKIIDALNLRVPVICSPKAIEGTTLQHDKQLLVARNESEFVNYISNLLANKELIARLNEEGYQYICNNFNNIHWTTQLVNFFESSQ
jgi:glycosyltransferase involved in cell wall biosynthesis